MKYSRFLISFFVSCIISGIIFIVLNDFGITWDEPTYFSHADRYVAWLKNPQLGTEHVFFLASPDDLHPPFRKLIGGLTHEILVNQLHVLDNTRGYRISAPLFVFPFILLFTYIAIGQFGYFIGTLIPFIFSCIPHVLFLTPLMTTDYALAVIWFMAIVLVVKGMKNVLWLSVTTVLVGFTALTKLYGFLILIPITGYWVWNQKDILFRKNNVQGKLISIVKILSILIGSFVTYVILWPWLWKSPFTKFIEYLSIHSSHTGVPVAIFGQTYTHAPWWYTPIMLFSTTPIFILIFFIIGIIYIVKKGKERDWIFLINALFPLVFFSLPGVYRYDGVRLFLVSFPFMCLVAARGMQIVIRVFSKKLQPLACGIIFFCWLGTVYTSVINIHPWESSYYNELVGGVRGASRLGFESEYWGNAYLGVLPWMNAHKKDMMCTYPIVEPFYYYQAMGQIEGGVVFNAGRGACKYMVVLMRQGMFDPFVKNMVATEKPVYQLLLQEVQLVGIYDIEGK